MKPREAIVRVPRVILGSFFVFDGVIKLTGILMTVQLFEEMEWGQWCRHVTGGLFLVGGRAILLRLRWIFYGAIMCACTVGTGALLYTLKWHRDPLLPAAITLLTVMLAVLTYPAGKQ